MLLQAITTRQALRICNDGKPRPDLFIHENGAYVLPRYDSGDPVPTDTAMHADANANVLDEMEEFEIVTHVPPTPNHENTKDACTLC